MFLQWNALRIGQSNVANTCQENSLCYVLSIVSGKNRYINDRDKNCRKFQAIRGWTGICRFPHRFSIGQGSVQRPVRMT
jgi:hypothetical protein